MKNKIKTGLIILLSPIILIYCILAILIISIICGSFFIFIFITNEYTLENCIKLANRFSNILNEFYKIDIKINIIEESISDKGINGEIHLIKKYFYGKIIYIVPHYINIYVNNIYSKNKNISSFLYQFIRTWLHEYRHYMQIQDFNDGSETYNMDDYIDAEDDIVLYSKQDIEKDANNFASKELVIFIYKYIIYKFKNLFTNKEEYKL